MKKNIETDVLIIGGGPVGIQASRMLCTSKPKPRVHVVRPEDYSMVYCAIPYAIEGLIPLEKTFKKDSLVTDSGAELVRGTVRSVNARDHIAILEDGREVTYGKMLLATGATPFRPPMPGVNAQNVFTVKTEADTRKILSQLARNAQCDTLDPGAHSKPPQKVVVIGAGAIGIEQALAYRANQLEVHLIEMQNHVLPHLIDTDMAGPVTEQLANAGVHLHLGTRLESLKGDQYITRVHLSGDETIDLDPEHDFVVISIGMTPVIDFLDASEFERTSDGLVVDKHMKTSAPDVWAAGDCVAYLSGIDGEHLGGKLATNAVPMAKVAARNMMGTPTAYPGFFNGAATIVGKLRIGGTGFTETFAASRGMKVYTSDVTTTARFPMMPDAGSIKIKLIFEKESDRLVGAQVLGTEAVAERIDLLTFAIQRGVTALELSELSYSAQPWQTFFPARNAIVEAATLAVSMGQEQ